MKIYCVIGVEKDTPLADRWIDYVCGMSQRRVVDRPFGKDLGKGFNGYLMNPEVFVLGHGDLGKAIQLSEGDNLVGALKSDVMINRKGKEVTIETPQCDFLLFLPPYLVASNTEQLTILNWADKDGKPDLVPSGN